MTMDISSLQRALLNQKLYPDLPLEVQLIETHISLLFLTGKFVYKIKKPVDFGFLDFTTLEKRRYFCEQEIKLNRRLSLEIYLGVVGIHREGEQISLEGKGEIVEYAVKKRRFPEATVVNR